MERQFYLTSNNDTNLVIDLMDTDGFATDPSGLGFKTDASLYSIGTDVLVGEQSVQYDPITFVMVFGNDSDMPYTSFREFMVKANSLDLVLNYVTDDGVAYKRDVLFISATKGEIDNEYYYLKSTITLTPLGPWYNWIDGRVEYTTELLTLVKSKFSSIGITSDASVRAKLVPLSSLGCVHMMKDTTIPIMIQYKFRYSGTLIQLHTYDINGNELYYMEWKFDYNAGDILMFSSDYNGISAFIQRDTEEIDIMDKLTSNSTGLIRMKASAIEFIYFGVDGFNTETDKVFIKEEKVVV